MRDQLVGSRRARCCDNRNSNSNFTTDVAAAVVCGSNDELPVADFRNCNCNRNRKLEQDQEGGEEKEEDSEVQETNCKMSTTPIHLGNPIKTIYTTDYDTCTCTFSSNSSSRQKLKGKNFTRCKTVIQQTTTKHQNITRFTSTITTTTTTTVLLLLLSLCELIARYHSTEAIAPTIDYSHNMRILKLPRSTQVGELIYRLKGSDGDPNSELTFGISGIEARALLDVIPVPRSWNEADVYLRSPLSSTSDDTNINQHNLTIYVSDGNKTTQVESTIIVTDPPDAQVNELDDAGAGAGNRRATGTRRTPFVSTKHVFHVPESAQPDESIGYITALDSEKSDLPVRFELRGRGADKFAIRYVFGPSAGQSKAELVLAQRVDYERQNLFALKVLALNAWTDSRYDTRNVATMDIVITVGDVQDTAPAFKQLPHSLRLLNTWQTGELVARLEAEDGDYADQRPVNYALDASSPLASYFALERATGELRLARPVSELALHAAWDSAAWSQLTVYASEQPDATSYEHLWPPMLARADLPLVLVDAVNEAPQFFGGWITAQDGGGENEPPTLHGYLAESSSGDLQNSLVRWFTNGTSAIGNNSTTAAAIVELVKSMQGRPFVLDLGLGANGTFELSVEGPDAHLFQVEPAFPVAKQSTFTLQVAEGANATLFDHEQRPHLPFVLDLVARDFGTVQRKSARIRCRIELLDLDDNAPQFESDLYTFSVYENAPGGQLIGRVRARDPDAHGASASFNVRYGPLVGQDAHLFRLDATTGQLTLGPQPLDRERRSVYLLLVEARDSAGTGRANHSQVMINVLDVNDNAPQFTQSHYDAVLLADGTFHQPLVVRALDADEPGAANSQVAYEIVAGNQNEQFAIDSVSGLIYAAQAPPLGAGSELSPAMQSHLSSGKVPQVPAAVLEPIAPVAAGAAAHGGDSASAAAGKILPSREVEREEPTRPPASSSSSSASRRRPSELRAKQVKSTIIGESLSKEAAAADHLPGLELLLDLESSERQVTASRRREDNNSEAPKSLASFASAHQYQVSALRAPPVTTLVVRAHDFGIPLRSSTVKVNIYNQALLTRSVSLILNGTAEQLELRRDAIERAFGSLTGSRASIESIDALSESSSLSVARVRLAIPQHSLVDLTDLSALMSAIDYKPSPPPTYYLSNERLVPSRAGNAPSGANITAVAADKNQQQQQQQFGNNIYSDIHSFALPELTSSQQLERRLLVYIIVVAVCILALLVIWMVYSCSRDDRHQQVKLIESRADPRSAFVVPVAAEQYHRADEALDQRDMSAANANKTYAKHRASASSIGNNLTKGAGVRSREREHSLDSSASLSRSNAIRRQVISNHSTDHQVLLMPQLMTTTAKIGKPDHYSMYNGQVWFEPGAPAGGGGGSPVALNSVEDGNGGERRASSAPSAASLDSNPSPGGGGQVPRNAAGQFFPNTIGYMENLASLGGAEQQRSLGGLSKFGVQKRQRRTRKVAPAAQQISIEGHPWLAPDKPPRASVRGSPAPSPANQASGTGKVAGIGAGAGTPGKGEGHVNEAFVHDDAEPVANGALGRAGSSRDLRSSSAAASDSDADSLVLQSDQELLGYDSNGTPIIATHAARTPAPAPSPPPPPPAGAKTQDQTARQVHPGANKVDRDSAAPGGGGEHKDSEQVDEAAAEKDRGERREVMTRSGNGQQSVRESNQSRAPATGDLMSELSERLARRKTSSEREADSSSPERELARDSGVGPTPTAEQQPLTKQQRQFQPGEIGETGETGEQTQVSRRPSVESSANSSDSSLRQMQNGDLLKKQSIFAITYSGVATDNLPG